MCAAGIMDDPLRKKVHELAHLVYNLTCRFPTDEKFGLVSQIRRCAISVPSNIIEGYARRESKVYLQHLEIAYGSLMEMKYQLYFSCQREFITTTDYKQAWDMIEEAAKMLWSAIASMENKVRQNQ